MRALQMPYADDLTDYGLDEEVERPKYRFRALCTSDECRTKSKSSPERTDVGIIKKVDRRVDYCPHCTNALYWERYIG